jgi:hypothetical protein
MKDGERQLFSSNKEHVAFRALDENIDGSNLSTFINKL